jgi:hypothetical protein
MADFFINYRTGDEENVPALLEHELSRRFETGVFFRASKSIPAGNDYEQALVTAVRRSTAVLAVIGPRWLEVRDEQQRRKIDNRSDWTRREILAAFENHVRVIPVLVGTARPLAAKDLPPALSELAVCQYVRLRSRDLEPDLDHLAAQLIRLVPELGDKKLRTPESGGTVNNAYNDAQIGVQGTVMGNVDFGNLRMTRGDRDER